MILCCSMDSSPAPTAPLQEEDEWDNDEFVIPDLGIDSILPVEKKDASPSQSPKVRKEESIYLGPHGAPPSQSSSSRRKQQFKQKLKEADKRMISGTTGGRENKLENLKELVGVNHHPPPNINSKGSSTSRDWLDPHCHESHFDKPNSH